MRIYIAGPMTGLPELNFPAFHAAAAEFRTAGHTVVNPAELNADPQASWQDCMRIDIRELVTCDSIFLLPNWTLSRGARLEFHIAAQLNMQIIEAAMFISSAAPNGKPRWIGVDVAAPGSDRTAHMHACALGGGPTTGVPA